MQRVIEAISIAQLRELTMDQRVNFLDAFSKDLAAFQKDARRRSRRVTISTAMLICACSIGGFFLGGLLSNSSGSEMFTIAMNGALIGAVLAMVIGLTLQIRAGKNQQRQTDAFVTRSITRLSTPIDQGRA